MTLGLVEGTTRQNMMYYMPFMKDKLVVITHMGSKLAAYDGLALKQLCALPVVFHGSGSGMLEVSEGAPVRRQIELSRLSVLLQLGDTEGIKLFLENSGALKILSIQAVACELVAGCSRMIDIEDFKVRRTSSFVEP